MKTDLKFLAIFLIVSAVIEVLAAKCMLFSATFMIATGFGLLLRKPWSRLAAISLCWYWLIKLSLFISLWFPLGVSWIQDLVPFFNANLSLLSFFGPALLIIPVLWILITLLYLRVLFSSKAIIFFNDKHWSGPRPTYHKIDLRPLIFAIGVIFLIALGRFFVHDKDIWPRYYSTFEDFNLLKSLNSADYVVTGKISGIKAANSYENDFYSNSSNYHKELASININKVLKGDHVQSIQALVAVKNFINSLFSVYRVQQQASPHFCHDVKFGDEGIWIIKKNEITDCYLSQGEHSRVYHFLEFLKDQLIWSEENNGLKITAGATDIHKPYILTMVHNVSNHTICAPNGRFEVISIPDKGNAIDFNKSDLHFSCLGPGVKEFVINYESLMGPNDGYFKLEEYRGKGFIKKLPAGHYKIRLVFKNDFANQWQGELAAPLFDLDIPPVENK